MDASHAMRREWDQCTKTACVTNGPGAPRPPLGLIAATCVLVARFFAEPAFWSDLTGCGVLSITPSGRFSQYLSRTSAVENESLLRHRFGER